MERLSRVLMTALTDGVSPPPSRCRRRTAEKGDSISVGNHPVVLGGLLTFTFLNMVAVPALCVRLYPQ